MNKPSESLLFVCMPWHSLKYPSLGLGILSSRIALELPTWTVKTMYENIEFAEFLAVETEGQLGCDAYFNLGEERQRSAPGEWIFSSALHGVNDWKSEEYRSLFVHGDELFQLALQAHRLAPKFISDLADRICAAPPDVVGLTSTFAQNVACLALAKAIKERDPKIAIVMGGANCDGVMGPALHREFRYIDYVISGEGEDAIIELLQAIKGIRRFEEVRNLTWRDVDGKSRVTHRINQTRLINNPIPDFDSYFSRFRSSSFQHEIEPSLVLETSRGCWWGEKHHCTFCGLNGDSMAYRTKPADKVMREIELLAERYQVLDIIMADNIIAMESFHDLLPALERLQLDLRIQFEIKANLTIDQVEALGRAKIVTVQPGIESLSTNVLRLMEKGVSAAQNVYLLREMEQHNITVMWNLISGFPGESTEDYRGMLSALEHLSHLQPPTGMARIMLQRFSPFFDKPWLGFETRRPASCYNLIYDLDSSALDDMVYMFDSDPLGIDNELIKIFNDNIDKWHERYNLGDSLTHACYEGFVEVSDNRNGRLVMHRIEGAFEAAVFLQLAKPSRMSGMRERLKLSGFGNGTDEIRCVLQRLVQQGLVFSEDGWFVSLSMAAGEPKLRKRDFILSETSATA